MGEGGWIKASKERRNGYVIVNVNFKELDNNLLNKTMKRGEGKGCKREK